MLQSALLAYEFCVVSFYVQLWLKFLQWPPSSL
jgi:hypothetical protein